MPYFFITFYILTGGLFYPLLGPHWDFSRFTGLVVKCVKSRKKREF